jgi:hypothetical protein
MKKGNKDNDEMMSIVWTAYGGGWKGVEKGKGRKESEKKQESKGDGERNLNQNE